MAKLSLLTASVGIIASFIQQVSGQQCSFCPGGEITEPDKPITVPGYEFIDNCGTVNGLAGALSLDDPQCELMQSISSYCGCPVLEDSCTLCPDGSRVANPEKTVPWMAGAFGGVVLTCELIEAYTASLSKDEKMCADLQLISYHCGCAPREDHCIYCGGEELKEEFRDVTLPLFSDEESGFEGTCEMYMLTQYQTPEKDIACEMSRFVSIHCGCNNGRLGYLGTSTEQEEKALAWIPRLVGSMSIVCSICIMTHILRHKSKGKHVYFQLMFLIAVFDVITALVWIVGIAAVYPVSPDTGLPWGAPGMYGTEASCTASAFFFHLGFTSIWLNISLTTYALLTIVYSARERQLKKQRIFLFGVPLVFGFGTSFATIPFVNIAFNHCQVQTYPREEYLWALLVFFVLPIATAVVSISIMLLHIFCKVRGQLKKSKRWTDMAMRGNSAHGPSAKAKNAKSKGTLEGEVFWQCCSYAAAFGLTWPIQILGQILGSKSYNTPFWFWVLVVIVGPIQGLTNGLCFFRPHLVERFSTKSRRKDLVPMPSSATMSMSKQLSRRFSLLTTKAIEAEQVEGNIQQDSILDPAVLLANLCLDNCVLDNEAGATK